MARTSTPARTAPAAAKATPAKAPTRKGKGKVAAAAPAKAAAAPAAPTPCRCGCSTPGTGTYRPGHDARHAGQVGRWLIAHPEATPVEVDEALAALPTAALRAKAQGMVDTATAKVAKREAAKVARAAAREAAKAAYAAALAGV